MEQHNPVAGTSHHHAPLGRMQLSHQLNICQDAFPHRDWVRVELTQLSRKLFLSQTCSFQAAALAVTNPSTRLTPPRGSSGRPAGSWLYLCLQRMSVQCSNSILYILELLIFSIQRVFWAVISGPGFTSALKIEAFG